ncbi:MAG: hypothetical protein ACD_54C00871G0002 [uncultured bacterium]|nr:MAG: hypothetical protein ACD_54C00871G0002 [uncultured bacterium]
MPSSLRSISMEKRGASTAFTGVTSSLSRMRELSIMLPTMLITR